MLDTCNSLSPAFLNFTTIYVLTILMNFSVLSVEIVIACSSNKKLNLPFQKTKQVIQSLSYVGPNTRNSRLYNLKYATRVNSFKHCIKKYSLKKLDNVEADIYTYIYI